MIEWPRAGGMVERGERVRDRKHPDETGTVLAVSDVPAAEYYVDAIGHTVAADNAAYPSSDPVVELVWCDLDAAADLGAARDDHTVYHFPLSRLVCGSCVRDVAPDALDASPYHQRSFAVDENHNEGYITKIRSQGYINSLLLARETAAGVELVAGHKRRWVAQHAGLETIAVRVVDLSAWEATIHYAEDHLRSVDDEPARQIVRSLIDRWDDRVFSVPSVAATIERVNDIGALAARTDGLAQDSVDG